MKLRRRAWRFGRGLHRVDEVDPDVPLRDTPLDRPPTTGRIQESHHRIEDQLDFLDFNTRAG
jgi:hypothetical protein